MHVRSAAGKEIRQLLRSEGYRLELLMSKQEQRDVAPEGDHSGDGLEALERVLRLLRFCVLRVPMQLEVIWQPSKCAMMTSGTSGAFTAASTTPQLVHTLSNLLVDLVVDSS